MHISVRAPLLSAAFSNVCSWIMLYLPSRSAAGGLFDHRGNTPGLAAGHWAARNDRDEVTFVRLAFLVMRQQLRGAANELAVRVVLDQAHDLDGDRLLHLGADNAACQRTLASSLGSGGFRRLLFFGHDCF